MRTALLSMKQTQAVCASRRIDELFDEIRGWRVRHPHGRYAVNTRELMTTREAARDLGYTIQHTRLLIRQEKIAASKFGRDWLVARESVVEYKAGQNSRAIRGD